MKRYLELWRIPGAPALMVCGTIARLGHGVTIVAWLLLVRAVSGNYAEAGLIAGAISLATAFAAPVAGRLVDRFTVSRVLPVIAAAYSVTQLILLTVALTDQHVSMMLAVAVVTGALFPPISPAIRAGWTHLTRAGSGHEAQRTTAMAAESTVFELVFVLGPLLLSAFVIATEGLGVDDAATAGTASAIVVASLTTVLGTVAVARGAALRSVSANAEGGRTVGLGPLRVPGFPTMLVITAAIAFGFGASPVAIAAFADAHSGGDGSAVTGLLIAIWSLGSAAGGLTYGALPWPEATISGLARRAAVVLAALAVGYAAWNLTDSVPAFAAILVLTGAVIAPATAVLAELVAAAVPAGMLTEAFTWFTCVNMSVAALGGAIAGQVVENNAHGVSLAFWICAVASGAAGLAALALRMSARSRRATMDSGALS
ncbi:MFS transporter [Gordonia sp. NPDC127522]|uniref:MFS transporter n=1 Tax=Gordonia sp. NPDC127522 TaxID=3345390 RepID=UPI00363EF52E